MMERNAVTVRCVWEHNGADTLLYAVDYVGAFTRGASIEAAMEKMPQEIAAYLRWIGEPSPDPVARIQVVVVEEKPSALCIRDADSDVLFAEERRPLTSEGYTALKALALKSALDFQRLYEGIPHRSATIASPRMTFYGQVPHSAEAMYRHTQSVNAYYFGEIGVAADNDGSLYECRKRGFDALEKNPDFLENLVSEGSYGEEWSLRKVLRRFIWHDRIHGRAMYRLAVRAFGAERVGNPFGF